MRKIDVMQRFSAARSTCEMVTYLLRNTKHRMADEGETGPDPGRPWLMPLTPQERAAKIAEAYWWSKMLQGKAAAADRVIRQYIDQEDIDEETLTRIGRERGFIE